MVETHTATLFFVGDHVYKLKKAVDLGFLDQRERLARLEACRNEVMLNRRLAPDVYLGVVDVIGEDGRPIDHLVDMRRLPEDRRLARCLERGEDLDDALRAIAHDLTALHERRPADAVHDRLGLPDTVRRHWTDGFDQLRGLDLAPARRDRFDAMEHLALRYLDGRGPLLEDRVAHGRIRDGHGDLQAEDIFLLDDGPRVLDCIDFGEEYRWGDVLADVAFLAMDLDRLGRPDLADRFLALHREMSADRWPDSLADHAIAYRAHVRAKVGLLRRAQALDAGDHDGSGLDGSDLDRVDALVDVALARLRRAQVRLVIVGGLPGTGKSTVAAGLGAHLGAAVLRTDEVRSRVPAAAGPDRYTAGAVAAVYDETLGEARRLLERGEQVVIDATWGRDEHRRLARTVAADTHSDLSELVCVLPRAAADERIRARLAHHGDPSEATPEVAALLAERFEPWGEATAISTDGTREMVREVAAIEVDQARARV